MLSLPFVYASRTKRGGIVTGIKSKMVKYVNIKIHYMGSLIDFSLWNTFPE